MGTSTSSMGLVRKTPALPPAKQNNTAINNNMVKVSLSAPPDYKFEHFVKLCQKLQEEKKLIQVQIRVEVVSWQQRAKNGDEGSDCKERILSLLSKFRDAQHSQDNLIEKEKLRLDAFRNCINEDTTNRIKSRLEFFVGLNKEHETLLELVRQDVQDCKSICKKYQDSQLRSKSFETWLKCPGTPAYDYGSIGSL